MIHEQRPQESGLHLFLPDMRGLRTPYYSDCHSHKSKKCDCRSYNNTASGEDIGIERFGSGTSAQHQTEPEHNHYSRRYHHDEIDTHQWELRRKLTFDSCAGIGSGFVAKGFVAIS